MLQVTEPSAYYFAGPLREAETIIVANSELEAKAEFKRISGKVVPPRRSRPVIIASPDIRELMEVEISGDTPRTRYGVVEELEFPLLSRYGPGSIRPDWTIDRQTGDVRVTGEYESFPASLLDLREKPKAEEVRRAGGRIIGAKWDLEAQILQEQMPWLQLHDGETLRLMLLAECDRWERKYER